MFVLCIQKCKKKKPIQTNPKEGRVLEIPGGEGGTQKPN